MAESFEKNAAFSLLRNVQAHTMVPKDQKLFTLSTSDSIDACLKALDNASVVAAPVMDDSKHVLGFLTALDLLAYAIIEAGVEEFADDTNSKLSSILSSKLASDVIASESFTKKNSGVNSSVFSNNPVSSVAELFAAGEMRVAVIGKKDVGYGVSHILSQSDLFRLMHESISDLSDVTDKKVKDLEDSPVSSPIDMAVTVSKKYHVHKAMARLIKEGVSALAVVDPTTGAICGEFSDMDMLGMSTDTLDELNLPISEYLAKHRPMSLDPALGDDSTTIGEVLEGWVNTGTKHFWIVDSDMLVTGSLSSTSLVNLIVNMTPSPEHVRNKVFAFATPGVLTLDISTLTNVIDPSKSFRVVAKFGGKGTQTSGTAEANPDTVEKKSALSKLGESVAGMLRPRSGSLSTAVYAFNKEFVFDVRTADQRSFVELELHQNYNDKKFYRVGSLKIDIPWVLNAFGTGNAGLASYELDEPFLNKSTGARTGLLHIAMNYKEA